MKKIAQGNLSFSLNKEDKTAAVIGFEDHEDHILIPRSIKYESDEFIITRISKDSFKYSSIKSIDFPPDSGLHVIEKHAFIYSTIESLTIPSTVSELKKGWCAGVT